MNHTIVTIFKNHKDIAVTPCDVNIMFNYTKTNLKDRDPEDKAFFREICLPGMTEEYKLPVLYTYCDKSDLKIIYVCEEKSDKIKGRLVELSTRIFSDLYYEKLISFLENSEIIMFEEISKFSV